MPSNLNSACETVAMRESLLTESAYSYGYTVLSSRGYGCGLMSKTTEKTAHDARCGQVPTGLLYEVDCQVVQKYTQYKRSLNRLMYKRFTKETLKKPFGADIPKRPLGALCGGRSLLVPSHRTRWQGANNYSRSVLKMGKIKTIADVKAELESKVKDGNKLIADKKPITTDFIAQFATLEKSYADLKAQEVYSELMAKKLPMIAAIKRYSYLVIRHQEVRDSETKALTEFKLAEKERQIDLLKFAKFGDLDTFWEHNVSRFNQLLCLRAAQELGYTASEMSKLAKTYFLQKKAEELAQGKTPVSNTQLCKLLQSVIDAILPPADEEKGNAYKCNNHDVRYLLMCYTKKGRNALSVAVSKDGFLRNLVMDIMHRIIEGKLYSLEYKTKKGCDMYVRTAEKEIDPDDELDADDEQTA